MTKDVNEGVKSQVPPGVCLPWAEQAERIGEIKGDAGIIKSEWEKLDVFAYLYLWFWVHR
jgi:hypothetical protein